MEFLNQPWFWSGFWAVIGSISTLITQELLRGRSQARIERLKIYDSEILSAHKSLYSFACSMRNTFAPPDNPRRDFIGIMKNTFQKSVKPNMLLFSPAIRQILNDFDAYYHCLGNSDVIPKIPFNEFIDNHLHNKINELEKHIERTVDSVLRSLR